MIGLTPGTVADIWSYVSPADVADTAADEAKAAKTGYRHHVCGVQVSNSDTAVATLVNILSGSTVLWTGFLPPYIAAAPGTHYIAAVFTPPLMGGIGEAINVINTTDSAQTRYNVQGFTTKAS
jgi:hypothetical protein